MVDNLKRVLRSGASIASLSLSFSLFALAPQPAEALLPGIPLGTSCAMLDLICSKDAIKWTVQDAEQGIRKAVGNIDNLTSNQKKLVEDAINKVKANPRDFLGAIGDLGKAGIIEPGMAIGRGGQIGMETVEQIAHDRAGSTKGYTDRKVGDGVRASEQYTDQRIGDLGQVDVGKSDGGNAKWNVNKTGQVVDGSGKVIRPTKLGSMFGPAGGYFTVDPNTGGLVAHNLTGGHVFVGPTHGDDGKILTGRPLRDVNAGLTEIWKTDGEVKTKIGDGLKGLGLEFTGGALKWIGGKEVTAAEWKEKHFDDLFVVKSDDEVIAAGGKEGQKRDKTVKEYVDDNVGAVKKYTEDAIAEGKTYIDNIATQSRQYTDSKFNQLNGKIKKLRARADAGIAGATAIGSLAFDTLKPNSIAGGLGVAKNKVAGAIGYQRNFSEKWRARATISVSDNYVQGGTSVGYSW